MRWIEWRYFRGRLVKNNDFREKNEKNQKLTKPINLGRVFDVDTCQLQSTARKMQLEKLHLLQVSNIFLQIFKPSLRLNSTPTPPKTTVCMDKYRLIKAALTVWIKRNKLMFGT